MKPAHQGDTTACRHTGMQGRRQGCRVEARVEAGGRRQGQLQPCSQSIAPGVLSPSGGSGVRDGARGVGVGEKGAIDGMGRERQQDLQR